MPAVPSITHSSAARPAARLAAAALLTLVFVAAHVAMVYAAPAVFKEMVDDD